MLQLFDWKADHWLRALPPSNFVVIRRFPSRAQGFSLAHNRLTGLLGSHQNYFCLT